MKPESIETLQSALKSGGASATPPPRAMEKLREKIRRGIEHPRPAPPPTWRERLGWDADSKPVLIYVSLSAVVVCALLGFGLMNSRNAPPPASGDEAAGVAPHLVVRPSGGQMSAPAPAPADGQPGSRPMFVTPSSDRISVRPQPVSVTSSNGLN